MYSKQQKNILFDREMSRKPRYVRVPLQKDNRVLTLNTDVKYWVAEQNFKCSMPKLERFAEISQSEVYHLRFDYVYNKKWFPRYIEYCYCFRKLNNSRLIRRMHITGFRMLNVVSNGKLYDILSDIYLVGIDETAIVLDSLITGMLRHLDRIEGKLVFHGDIRTLRKIRSSILSHYNWNAKNWRLTEEPVIQRGCLVLRLSTPLKHFGLAFNIVMLVAGKEFHSLNSHVGNFTLDREGILPKRRHGVEDIKVLISGYRIRRFQTIGKLNKLL